MILINVRKKFRSDVTPSDRQLWAIGMVVVRWTLIEQYVTAYVHSFTNGNDANDTVRRRFDSTRAMQSRLDQWEELSRKNLQAGWLRPMLDLINEVRQLLDMRDKIVHGTWSDKENATMIAPEAHGPFSWGNPGHPFSWRLDYHGILNVALRMDRLQGAMFDFVLKASGVGNSGKDFTISSALKRIQNTE
jgi:hypothetical protein